MAVREEQIVIVDEWRGLYSESWKGVIVDDAFAHPAKFSRALIRKIYDHVIAEGWASKGDSVVDPFGGVALGGLDAMRHGLNWFGCELEQKFVGLGGRNIALWNERYSLMPNWGMARLLQGDSRRMAEALREASCSVSSPPYGCDSLHRAVNAGREEALPAADRMGKSAWGGGYGNSEGQLSSLPATTEGHSLAIASPPYANDTVNERNGIDQSLIKKPGGHNSQSRTMTGYGEASGQLGAMREGDHSIAISSPPYIDSVNSHDHGIDWSKVGAATGNRKRGKGSKHEETLRAQMAYTEDPDPANLGAMPEGQLCVTSPPFESSTQVNNTPGDITAGPARWEGGKDSAARVKQDYADYASHGNLGNMRGGFEAAVSSPPYQASLTNGEDNCERRRERLLAAGLGSGNRSFADGVVKGKSGGWTSSAVDGYSSHVDNLGNQQGETFWSASRLILEQLHQVLTPNAHAVFVVKAFVRDKKIVDFPAQWAQLCEAVGFKLLHDHHALLTEEHGKQDTLTGEGQRPRRTVERKSFFRRLAEQKGSPRIDYENVLCFRKVA